MTSTVDDSATERTIFTILGIPWKTSSKSWLFIPTRLAFSLAIALVFLQGYSFPTRMIMGFFFAGLLLLSQFFHILGHTLSGRHVGSTMAANVILDTKILTYYPDRGENPSRKVHLSRALGGPIANGFLGMIGLAGWLITESHYWWFFTAVNFLLSVGVLLPFPGVDGEVVWRELRRRRE